MALYLLNFSVDTADPSPDYIPEDLSFNDQESMLEIFLEKILGYENAIAEYDEQDTDEQNKNSQARIDLYLNQISHLTHMLIASQKQSYLTFSKALLKGYLQRFTPPPQALI